jgi:SAM-dependent methyltransferase
MATQLEQYAALAGDVDRELSWTEAELPETARTKHVHRLHPYLGKFVPQLVEVFLHRHVRVGERVLDPFCGSGTTLVECSTYGAHAAGIDVSAFNALLARVKTSTPPAAELRTVLEDGLAAVQRADPAAAAAASPYLRDWFAPRALAELLAFRDAIPADGGASADAARVVLSRGARSARLAPHHRLEAPTAPQRAPYWCHKHRRTCTPVGEAAKFLRRYAADSARRLAEYAALRRDVEIRVLHGDARDADVGGPFDCLITSPPYPGRIDYHGQHRYAFELLGLPERRPDEIGAPACGLSRAAIAGYCDDAVRVLANARLRLRPGAAVVIVVDDARGLYDGILAAAGLELCERRLRHVNRRTGRRDDGFLETVLVARA